MIFIIMNTLILVSILATLTVAVEFKFDLVAGER